mmetsp:Transcript_37835/g.103995  ORF Transcript_37835/g.103995 Transcript_37835/m.103995 type:complete len:212 (+) Transcript_37835:833-1468(+)
MARSMSSDAVPAATLARSAARILVGHGLRPPVGSSSWRPRRTTVSKARRNCGAVAAPAGAASTAWPPPTPPRPRPLTPRGGDRNARACRPAELIEDRDSAPALEELMSSSSCKDNASAKSLDCVGHGSPSSTSTTEPASKREFVSANGCRRGVKAWRVSPGGGRADAATSRVSPALRTARAGVKVRRDSQFVEAPPVWLGDSGAVLLHKRA